MFAEEPIGAQVRSPVMRFTTLTQSPAAHTCSRLVFIWLSTTMVPFGIISRPVLLRKAVLARMPSDITTTSALISPSGTRIPSALDSPSTASRRVFRRTLIPLLSK